MRAIKLRFWSTYHEPKMLYPELDRNISFRALVEPDDRFIPLQWTGLVDKNGVEIYEGDIVKRLETKFDFDKPEGVDSWEEEQISYVKYLQHSFWIDAEFLGWEGEGLWSWSEIEVIGNLYEHPHFLPATDSIK